MDRILDPRSESVARAYPYANAANIPLDLLSSRPHELPAPGETVFIASCDEAWEAAAIVESLKRTPQIVAPVETGDYRQTPLWSPNPVLVGAIEGLFPGTALDLGCGSGRDAVWLATRGWQVTGIDHLPDALERVRDLSDRYSPDNPVRTECTDLHSAVPEGIFELAWMAYALFERAFRECRATVKVVETFAPCHREHYGKPSRILSLEQVRSWNLGEEIFAEEGWRGDRCTTRVAVRTA